MSLRRGRRSVRHNLGACLGFVLLGGIIVLAGAGPIIYRVDPWARVGRRFEPPASRFALGTDYQGRDVLAGVVSGARTSLTIGAAATLVIVAIGVLIGTAAGYQGGRVDEVLMRLTEFFQILPAFLLAMAIVAIFGPTLWTVTAAIGLSNWPGTARLVRSEFLTLRERDFVLAARALGLGDVRVVLREILPNALPPVIVNASLTVGVAILFEAGLSFLGLTDPNVMSWGYMIGSSRDYLREAWWTVTFPGLAIVLSVLALSLVGDWLNDVLNPRLGERRAG